MQSLKHREPVILNHTGSVHVWVRQIKGCLISHWFPKKSGILSGFGAPSFLPRSAVPNQTFSCQMLEPTLLTSSKQESHLFAVHLLETPQFLMIFSFQNLPLASYQVYPTPPIACRNFDAEPQSCRAVLVRWRYG